MAAVIVDHRQDHALIGRMRVAVVGRVVQEGVAALQLGVMVPHRPAHQIGADHDMDRQALGGGQQAAIGGQEHAGEVVAGVEHARACGPEQGVGHLARDRVEARGEDRHPHPVVAGALTRGRRHAGCAAHAVITRLPDAVRRARAPGSTTTVVKEDSTIAGPTRGLASPTASKRRTAALTQPWSVK